MRSRVGHVSALIGTLSGSMKGVDPNLKRKAQPESKVRSYSAQPIKIEV
jgi:hypothetical protein